VNEIADLRSAEEATDWARNRQSEGWKFRRSVFCRDPLLVQQRTLIGTGTECIGRVTRNGHQGISLIKRNWHHSGTRVSKRGDGAHGMGYRSVGWMRGRAHEHQQSHVQNDRFFADLHGAFDRLEREFSDLPVVLTGQGDVFSAGIDFQYSFGSVQGNSGSRRWKRQTTLVTQSGSGTAAHFIASSPHKRHQDYWENGMDTRGFPAFLRRD
jgi:hypothetical protein